VNSNNLLVVVAGVALAITIVGWRRLLAWALAGLFTLAVLGLVQAVTLLSVRA
jgi:hypothetical protein